ncbi:MAG: hypothetical protein AAGL68_04085, partial [Pseudomonadota bacterium]
MLNRQPTGLCGTSSLQADNLKLTMLQIRADALFTSYDLINDAIASRADPEVGLEMAGCDTLLKRALSLRISG